MIRIAKVIEEFLSNVKSDLSTDVSQQWYLYQQVALFGLPVFVVILSLIGE